jgi:uncharacterized protein YjbJ (UPF0337 family)
MNRDVIKSQWTRLSVKMRSNWGKLTLADVSYAEGDREYLVGMLQKRYGFQKDMAQRQVKQFERFVS